MDRNSLPVTFARMFQRLPLDWLRKFEINLLNGKSHSNFVILIAPPRSGSTLLYQSLIHATDLGYLSNVGNALYKLPAISTAFMTSKSFGRKSDFVSNLGFSNGIFGPSEGQLFWEKWTASYLQENAHSSEAFNSPELDYFERVLAYLESNGKTLCSGYVGHVLYRKKLSDRFPNAIFVRLKRDKIDHAMSIFRILEAGELDWFSVFPKECQGVKFDSNLEKAAHQVFWINKRMNHEITAGRDIVIRYEDLCENPNKCMDGIVGYLRAEGLGVNKLRDLPEKFSAKTSPVEKESELALRSELSKIFGKIELATINYEKNGG